MRRQREQECLTLKHGSSTAREQNRLSTWESTSNKTLDAHVRQAFYYPLMSMVFFIIRVFAFRFWSLRRRLLSTGFLFALWVSLSSLSSVRVEVQKESRYCHLRVGLEGQNGVAVIGTRRHRNT